MITCLIRRHKAQIGEARRACTRGVAELTVSGNSTAARPHIDMLPMPSIGDDRPRAPVISLGASRRAHGHAHLTCSSNAGPLGIYVGRKYLACAADQQRRRCPPIVRTRQVRLCDGSFTWSSFLTDSLARTSLAQSFFAARTGLTSVLAQNNTEEEPKEFCGGRLLWSTTVLLKSRPLRCPQFGGTAKVPTPSGIVAKFETVRPW